MRFMNYLNDIIINTIKKYIMSSLCKFKETNVIKKYAKLYYE